MIDHAVSKRVFLTLPDVVYQDLEDWASSQGRPVANLGAFIVEKAVEKAKSEGAFVSSDKAARQSKSKKEE